MRSWFYECLCGVSFHIVWLWDRKEIDIWDLEHNGGISQSFDPLFIENRSWVNNEVCERLFSGPGVSDQTTNSVVIPPYDRGDRWPGPPWSHQGRVICSFGCARQMLGPVSGWWQLWSHWLSPEFILSSIHPASNGSIKKNKQQIFVLFASQFN